MHARRYGRIAAFTLLSLAVTYYAQTTAIRKAPTIVKRVSTWP